MELNLRLAFGSFMLSMYRFLKIIDYMDLIQVAIQFHTRSNFGSIKMEFSDVTLKVLTTDLLAKKSETTKTFHNELH